MPICVGGRVADVAARRCHSRAVRLRIVLASGEEIVRVFALTS